MKKVYLVVLTISLALASCKSSGHGDLGDGIFADIKTNKGDIIVKLEYEKTPVTVANFVSLAEGKSPFVSDSLKGEKYYDGIIFHRVMKNFMIQTGDPLGNGTGNPGYKFKDEFNDSLTHHKAGILSMANSGSTTNGSQFFITHKATPHLNGRHTVFGEVVEGMNVVDSIANVEISQDPMTKDRPLEDIVMETVEIIRNGKEARRFDAVEVMTNYFAEAQELIVKQEKLKAEADKYKLIFAAELAQQKEKAEELPSGLRILSLNKGDGSKPKLGQQVLVNYAGWLPDGTLFDTNLKEVAEKFGAFEQINKMHRGDMSPSPMHYSPDSRLVPGFREGLLSMKIGDKIRLFIPPHLGYGAQGGGPIPPNSDLIFDLEITGIVK
ncbi:MAG: peptidylprolyl isomerase [Flavobacteriaceae bacterium]